MNAASLFQPRWLLSAVTAALVVVVGLMLSQTAHAGSPPDLDSTQCKFVGPGFQYCISLDPATDTNPVGDDHTATASLSVFDDTDPVEPEPGELEGIFVVIVVFDGPNAGISQSVIAPTNADGQLALTYTGDGGPGTDTIATVACLDFLFQDVAVESSGVQEDPCALEEFIEFCLINPAAECLDLLTDLEGPCAGESEFICDIATKDWVEEPTPTPAPSATPSPTPTAAPAAALPTTGADPTGGSTFPLTGTLALVLGGMALLAVGAGVARRAR